MAPSHTHIFAAAALAAAMATGSAQAGGLEANGYNWDLLFDPATYAGKGTVTYVIIDQDVEFGGSTIATSANRVYYNYGFKADLLDNASCAVSVQNPFGSGTDRDAAYARGTRQSVRERITSTDLGLTCAYGFGVGPGVASIIGGISAQHLDYEATVALPFPGPVRTEDVSLDGMGFGWRAGLVYEMPEIALRVSAIYNAAIDYELSGNAFGAVLPAASATADVTTPQSVEIKAQMGIAPRWLALGGIKWVDWSVLDVLTVQNATSPIATTLGYEDGWTVTAGLGHAVTEDLTVLGSLTWDKGTSREDSSGVPEAGTQTDRWGVTLGGAYSIADNVELSGGVSYSLIDGGRNARGESWDRGSVFAVSGSLKASF